MKAFQRPAPRPADVDVPLPVLEAEICALVARQRMAARMDRVPWLIAHPEWSTGRATAGEAAEMRHLLDPALDYTHQETT